MNYKVLFYIEDGRIASYIFEDGKFEPSLYKGEVFCTLKQKDFWKWWIENNSVMPIKDQFSVCVIADDKSLLNKFKLNDIELTSENCWSAEEISNFTENELLTISKKTNFKLVFYNKRKVSKVASKGKYEELFFSLFPIKDLSAAPIIIRDEKKPEIVKEGRTDLVKYFRNETKNYRNKL